MALYYFTEEDHAVRRSTNYRARPEDGWRKLAIGADRVALDLYDRAKRRLGISDEKVQAVLARLHRIRRKGSALSPRLPRPAEIRSFASSTPLPGAAHHGRADAVVERVPLAPSAATAGSAAR